jgi:hypothetical protein
MSTIYCGETDRAKPGQAVTAAASKLMPSSKFIGGTGGSVFGLPYFLQPKLAISKPGDLAEVEADRVAEQVVRMPDPFLQRQCAACEEEETVAVSRKAQGAIGGDAPASVGSVIRSPGQPLASSARAFFEPRFGQDLSHVRVHTDGGAQQSARDVNALAYTVGSHVVFATGRYASGTPSGQRLLAHELIHVLQQQPQVARQEHPLDPDPPAPQPHDAPQADKAGEASAAGSTPVTSNCVPTGFSRADFLKNGGTTAEFGLTTLTVSDATFPALDLVRKGKGVQVQATTAALPKISSIFTQAGVFDEGEATVLGDGGDCPSGKYPLRWVITAGGAQKIQEGEQEHCNDFNLAFDLSLGKYRDAINQLAAKKKIFANEAAVKKDLRRIVGFEFDDLFTVFACLARKSLVRDRNDWHKPVPTTRPPSFQNDCKFARAIVSENSLRRIGLHDSAEIVKDCGESPPVTKKKP